MARKTGFFVLSLLLSPFPAGTAASSGEAPAPLTSRIVVYYSFDSPPAEATLIALQAETARIFNPALISITWRALESRSGEVDADLVVVRFHGACLPESWPAASHATPTQGGFPLANSKIYDARVLPFADVDCGALRAYLAGEHFENPGAALGIAMARVLAHEIYHMLTANPVHARSGIARPEHSREELTAASFVFGKSELEWLRDWSARSRMSASIKGDGGASAGDSESGAR